MIFTNTFYDFIQTQSAAFLSPENLSVPQQSPPEYVFDYESSFIRINLKDWQMSGWMSSIKKIIV